MGLFSTLIKTVSTPVAIVADVVEVAKGKEPKKTEKLIKSIEKDIE